MSQDGSDASSVEVIIRKSPLEHETELGDGKTIIYSGEPMLGEGCHAQVYPCTLKEILDCGEVTHRKAAVKCTRLSMLPGDEEEQNRLREELDHWTHLSKPGTQHENVLHMYTGKVIQMGDQNPVALAVTEIMDMTLDQLIFEDREFIENCTYRSLLQIAEKICEGLAHLHTNRFSHPDLKPSNVLISKNADRRLGIKISGFGFTRKLDDGWSSILERYRGTRGFTAPEIVLAQVVFQKTENTISNAVDIYSLGVLLWVLFNRKKPSDFQSASRDIGRRIRILNGYKTEDIQCGAPSEICDLIESCLSYNPQDNSGKSHGRPSTEEILEKIREMQEDEIWASERPPTYL